MKKVLVVLFLFCFVAVMTAPVIASDGGKVNINTASVEELTQLKKIGPKTAERIVAYRNDNGPFKTVDDLKDVKGIGDRILELNKGRISVGKK